MTTPASPSTITQSSCSIRRDAWSMPTDRRDIQAARDDRRVRVLAADVGDEADERAVAKRSMSAGEMSWATTIICGGGWSSSANTGATLSAVPIKTFSTRSATCWMS